MKRVICTLLILILLCLSGCSNLSPEQEEAYDCIKHELLCDDSGYSYDLLLETLMHDYHFNQTDAIIAINALNFTEEDWVNEAEKAIKLMIIDSDIEYSYDRLVHTLVKIYLFTPEQAEKAADEFYGGK